MISRRKIFTISAILGTILLFCSGIVWAETATLNNGGFPQKGIWYSQEKFFSGDKIKIFSAVYNSSQYDFSGTVEFYDNEKITGVAAFSVAGKGGLKDVFIDWQATAGNHKISAKIVSAKILKSGGESEPIILQNNQTGIDEIFVDTDTDEDKIGNVIDNDDDNDGRNDQTEIKQGTDPLKKDLPPPVVFEQKILSGTSTSSALAVAAKTVNFVANTAKATVKSVNKIADSQNEKIEIKKEEIREEIKEIEINNEEIQASETEKPLKYAYLTALSLAGFVLDKKIIFYLLLAFVLYKILKFLYKKIFKKEKV